MALLWDCHLATSLEILLDAHWVQLKGGDAFFSYYPLAALAVAPYSLFYGSLYAPSSSGCECPQHAGMFVPSGHF
eukprot:gene23247-29451_t